MRYNLQDWGCPIPVSLYQHFRPTLLMYVYICCWNKGTPGSSCHNGIAWSILSVHHTKCRYEEQTRIGEVTVDYVLNEMFGRTNFHFNATARDVSSIYTMQEGDLSVPLSSSESKAACVSQPVNSSTLWQTWTPEVSQWHCTSRAHNQTMLCMPFFLDNSLTTPVLKPGSL